MNDLAIKSIMLDTSFCIRLMDNTDALHANSLEYYKFFLEEKISMHISTIAIAEYGIGDDPINLPLSNLQIEVFDFLDAQTASKFHKEIKGSKDNIAGYNRRIITNDVKIIAQISTKKIDALISKDIKSIKQYIDPLSSASLLSLRFIDLNIPLATARGKLF